MNEWITNRLPKLEEATNEGDVWVYDIEADEYYIRNYEEVIKGQPWVEIPPPKPYVKSKRFRVLPLLSKDTYDVYDGDKEYICAGDIPTFEAAERIAAIYEEVIP